MSSAFTVNTFGTFFQAIYDWTWGLFHMLDSIVLVQFNGYAITIYNLGIFVIFAEVLFIIYIRLRSG